MLRFLGDAIEVEALVEGGQVRVDGKPTPVVAPAGLIGPVKLFVRPWQLQLVEPATAHLTGTVRSSYRSQGRQRIEVVATSRPPSWWKAPSPTSFCTV